MWHEADIRAVLDWCGENDVAAKWYLGASPSKKSVQRLKTRVGDLLVRSNLDRAPGSNGRPL